jgi:HAD superfamily hydrolase (TIGR01484 family)
LFTDLDGTATTAGRVEPATFAAVDELDRAGIPVILVTGRPAGWGQALAALCPFRAVVTENGGVTYARTPGGLQKLYGLPPATLPEWRRRMRTAATDAMVEVPNARISHDSKYREVDLAIDWNEDVHLKKEEADRVVAVLRQQGFTATRSSVHVNFGPPEFDKLSACKLVIERVLNGDPRELESYVYVGDALNDAPMFAGFPKTVGVANIKQWWDELEHHPRYLTSEAEGRGFRQVVQHVLSVS